MNTERTKQHIAVMQAALDGKQIQCRAYGRTEWHDIETVIWNFANVEYRAVEDQEEEAYRFYLEGYTQHSQETAKINAATRRGMRAVIDAVKRGDIK